MSAQSKPSIVFCDLPDAEHQLVWATHVIRTAATAAQASPTATAAR